MAFSGARIEAYSFADTTARWKSTHTLGVTIGGAATALVSPIYRRLPS